MKNKTPIVLKKIDVYDTDKTKLVQLKYKFISPTGVLPSYAKVVHRLIKEHKD